MKGTSKWLKGITLGSLAVASIVTAGFGFAKNTSKFIQKPENLEESEIATTLPENAYELENASAMAMMSALGSSNEATAMPRTNVTVSGTTVTCDSIVQGVRDCDLPSGNYTFVVNGKSYPVELIVYNDDVTYTSNTTLGDSTTTKKMLVVKYKKNLTINSGVTVTARNVSNLTYKKGMFICVMGKLTNNGTITMTARGTYNQSGEDVYLWKNTTNSFEYVPATGGAGRGAFTTGARYVAGLSGYAGTARRTGGGGQGGIINNGLQGAANSQIGASTAGTSYAGGNGSGGLVRCNGGAIGASTTAATLAKGGNGYANDGGNQSYNYYAGGGAGVSAGSSGKQGNMSGYQSTGEIGSGGLLVVFANSLQNTGTISSNGSAGAGGSIRLSGTYVGAVGGGGSGGGSVNVFYNQLHSRGNYLATGRSRTEICLELRLHLVVILEYLMEEQEVQALSQHFR